MKTVKLFSQILNFFSKTRKLIKNGENNFNISLILVNFRDFRQKVRKVRQKIRQSDFFALRRVWSDTSDFFWPESDQTQTACLSDLSDLKVRPDTSPNKHERSSIVQITVQCNFSDYKYWALHSKPRNKCKYSIRGFEWRGPIFAVGPIFVVTGFLPVSPKIMDRSDLNLKWLGKYESKILTKVVSHTFSIHTFWHTLLWTTSYMRFKHIPQPVKTPYLLRRKKHSQQV